MPLRQLNTYSPALLLDGKLEIGDRLFNITAAPRGRRFPFQRVDWLSGGHSAFGALWARVDSVARILDIWTMCPLYFHIIQGAFCTTYVPWKYKLHISNMVLEPRFSSSHTQLVLLCVDLDLSSRSFFLRLVRFDQFFLTTIVVASLPPSRGCLSFI